MSAFFVADAKSSALSAAPPYPDSKSAKSAQAIKTIELAFVFDGQSDKNAAVSKTFKETIIIVLLKSISEDLVVNAGKNFKLNLNNHSITTTLENNGTINVYNGSLQNFELTTVINNGTFIMGEDDGKVSSTNMRIISEVTTVENNGTFIMNDGYIEGTIPITTDINKIASFARIYTETDSQTTRKYLQSLSEEAIKNGETDLIITIDPASGVYKGSKAETIVYLKHQEAYEVEEPTKNGCEFVGLASVLFPIFEKYEDNLDMAE